MDYFDIIRQQMAKAADQFESILPLKSHRPTKSRYILTEHNGGLYFYTLVFQDVAGQQHSMPLTTQEFIDFVEREYLI